MRAISQAILNTKPDPILGVDCEGLSKGRPLSLLQVSFYNNSSNFPMSLNIYLYTFLPYALTIYVIFRCISQGNAIYLTY